LPMNLTQLRKLSYDEVAKCNKCGFCLPNCPIYLVEGKESSAPRGRNAITRAVIEGRLEWSPEIEKSIFSCLGCGACTAACFPKVQTKDLVFRDRECLVGEGLYPKIADSVVRFLEKEHNITDDDNRERAEWKELIKNLPEGAFEKERAEVIFFVGCVASFFPMAQKIPVNMARIMDRAKVDFTILGGEEWCCGFPLIGTGMPDKIKALMEHNVQKVEEVGAKKVVFTCPSCYHTWKHLYRLPGVELYHASQMLHQMILDQKIPLKEMNVTVTYHDPCYLGRHNGVYDAPREVLSKISGLELNEMPESRAGSLCCGGGGGRIWMETQKGERFSDLRIKQAVAVGAEALVTSCPYCITHFEESRLTLEDRESLQVKDITEIIAEAI